MPIEEGKPDVAATKVSSHILTIGLSALALALFFGCWAMRAAFATDVLSTDEARHAMNGAAVLDMMREGGLSHPATYLRLYFSHSPALSMPYHPPLFYAFEALCFTLFGVSVSTARLSVAICVGIAAALLFFLERRLTGSMAQAVAVTIVFFSLPMSQFLAADVMLEMPALVLTLASLLCIAGAHEHWSLRRAIWAAIFAAASIWTKQVIFLILVPPLMMVIAGKWARVRAWATVFYEVVVCCAAAGLALLWRAAGLTSFPKNWGQRTVSETLRRNFEFYVRTFFGNFSWMPLVAAVTFVAILWLAKARLRDIRAVVDPIYPAWILATLLVLLIIPATDQRYLFFIYPALISLSFQAVFGLLGNLRFGSHARWLGLAFAGVFFVLHVRDPVPVLKGPGEVARLLRAWSAKRIVICAFTDGSTIFALRVLDQDHQATVIRGDKLPWPSYTAGAFEEVASSYRADVIVLEKLRKAEPWYGLIKNPSKAMHLVQTVSMTSTERQFRDGVLYLYRFTCAPLSRSSTPEFPVWSTGKSLVLDSPDR